MSWAGSEIVDVYLGTTGLAVDGAHAGRAWLRPAASWGEALAEFEQWARSHPAARRVRLWLAGELCRPFLVPALAGVKRQEERERIAASLAPAATGLAGACRVWVDASGVSQAAVAAALELAVWEALDAALRTARLRPVSVRPWWSEALRICLARKPDALALACHDGSALTLLGGTGADFSVARTFHPVADVESARAALLRAALSAQIEDARGGRVTLAPFEPGSGEAAGADAASPSRFAPWTRWQPGLL